MAGDSEVEIDMTEVADRCMEKFAMLYNRFVHLLNGPALTLHLSVVGENGLEVWRLLWLKIMNPGKVKKSQDFLAQVNRGVGQHVEA